MILFTANKRLIEMYAFWPCRLAGVTRPATLQLARNTWETIPGDPSWVLFKLK